MKKVQLNLKDSKFCCQYCDKSFSRKYGLERHLEQNRCPYLKGMTSNPLVDDVVTKLTQNFEKIIKNNQREQNLMFEKQIAELKEKPNVTQNILQVVCVGQKDNYLDMLTKEYGDFGRALEFIKDCALSNLTGDCKLIGKIYLNRGPQLSLYFVDKNRTKIAYYNENKEIVRDTKELFGRKLANNLQNSYLKGVNHLITDNLENKRCPNKFLEDYDLQMWNQHILDLSDIHYQKTIINRLNIPIKTN